MAKVKQQALTYRALGIMSGTSLDGLDLALCDFTFDKNAWDYEILDAQTIPYSAEWTEKLRTAQNLSGLDFIRLHKSYGTYIGEQVNLFLKDKLQPMIVCSHGHTVSHLPNEKLTFQIGDGTFIAAETGIPTISDFRTLDTALGGQGAPLVPIGDALLFPEYAMCLNIGGFANISYTDIDKNRLAFDICPANFVLNYLAKKLNFDFDENGEIARTGTVIPELLSELDTLLYYAQKPPKSLGREFVENEVFPILNNTKTEIPDVLRTFTEHIAIQISKAVENLPTSKILVTGGGARNIFLIELLKKYSKHSIEVPDDFTVNYKEALIFGFLGVLRLRGEANCLSSVTGAKKNNIGGTIILV